MEIKKADSGKESAFCGSAQSGGSRLARENLLKPPPSRRIVNWKNCLAFILNSAKVGV